MESASAFSPANLSLIFETYPAAPPHGRGSLGVGITLEEGVTVRVSRAPEDAGTRILVGGEAWDFPTVRSVLTALDAPPVTVEIEAAWPFGCGFGMSGGSALATALALNALLGLRRRPDELGMIAHRAEVDNATGLGDVGGQCNGGIMIKTRRYEPITVELLPVPDQILHCRVFGPLHTASVINSPEKVAAINRAGHAALETLTDFPRSDRPLSMVRLLEISRTFAAESGLLVSARVREAIAAAGAAGHAASMIMLGEAVVASGPFPGSRPARICHHGAQVA